MWSMLHDSELKLGWDAKRDHKGIPAAGTLVRLTAPCDACFEENNENSSRMFWAFNDYGGKLHEICASDLATPQCVVRVHTISHYLSSTHSGRLGTGQYWKVPTPIQLCHINDTRSTYVELPSTLASEIARIRLLYIYNRREEIHINKLNVEN